MKKISIFTMLLILIAANSFAADAPQDAQNTDKSYFVGITSQRVFGGKAYHLNFGKYLSKLDFISLEYGKGQYEHLELVNSHRPTFDYINAGVYYRRFVPNPFYFLSDSLNIFFGVYRQFWTGDFKYNVCDHDIITYGDCPLIRGQQVKIDLKMEVTFASLGVGTHWLFDNGITFGVDWAILSRPLYRHTDIFIHETAPGDVARSQIQDDLNRLEDEIVKIVTYPMVIVATLGWSF